MEKIQPSIAILLATYNGANNLQEQLDSYATQTLRPTSILVSDDGSTDATLHILEQFAAQNSNLNMHIFKGPCQGAAQNFLHLLRHVPDHIKMVALSDQDDIWFPEKLERGAGMLQKENGIHLYCARTLEWEAEQNLRRPSYSPQRAPSFKHALVQNIAGGNTMILNWAALDLVRAASQEVNKIIIHDWWIYQIITGAGGCVTYDKTPMMLYRQHPMNLVGANRGIIAKFKRFKAMLLGEYRDWGTLNIRALNVSKHRLTEKNRRLLQMFKHGRDGSLLIRVTMVWKNGFYRQGLFGLASLYFAAFFRRL